MAYLIVTIPVLEYVLPSALLQNVYVPSFIAENLTNTWQGSVLYYGLYVLIIWVNIRLIYSIPLSVLEPGKGFGTHLKRSWELTRGRNIWHLLGSAVLLVLLLLLFAGVILGLILVSEGLEAFFELGWVDIVTISLIWGVTFAGNIVTTLTLISYLLYQLQPDSVMKDRQPASPWHGWGLLVLVFLIGGVSLMNSAFRVVNRNPNAIQIIAHRGYVAKGVENSLQSLEAAKKAGANYSELDVILSKDGELIVSHDDNVERLTGKKIKISQSDSASVLGLPARQNGHHSHLVSLRDYIAKAKALDIKLLIELKPGHGDIKRYAKHVVMLLKEMGVEKDFLVMSLNLPVIEEVEHLDPTIQTGYTISFQFGHFTASDVDFYAIEDFSYNEALAHLAHQKGKKVYVWTVNDEATMANYLQSSADGIITDYPNRARELKEELKEGQNFYWLQLR